jgi:hypothetical protein
MRWAMLAAIHGADIDPAAPPTSKNLKTPLLWLAQAEAMAQAAVVLVKHEPLFDNMPAEMRGICDSQYCAVALMLVGYSLEVCLKAVTIMHDGIDVYSEAERKFLHHNLRDLASFIDGLSDKDLAILDLLSHFVAWAGRYPDPGIKFIAKHEKIFEISEEHQVTAKDLFGLAARVTGHVRKLTENV